MKESESRWVVLLSTCLGFFMIMLDTTIVYVATPSILAGLHAGLDQVLWVFNGYLLAFAVLLVTSGRLGDLLGPRNLFAAGLTVFTLASALCGLSQDAGQLIAARILQGVGGAMLAPQTLPLLLSVFPPQRRGAAFGVNGAVIGVATVAGPTLGGFLVTVGDWRWIFFINVPVGVLAVAAALLWIPDLRPGRRHRLDLPGVGLASLGLLLLVFALIEGQRYHWSAAIWSLLAAGCAVVGLFLLWERRQPEPLIPLDLFRNRDFSVMSWAGAVVQFAMQVIFIPVPIYTQAVLGLTPLESGLVVVPISIASGAVSPVAGRLADRLGAKYLLMAGLGLFAAGTTGLVGAARPNAQPSDLMPWFAVAGIGMGLTFAPMMTQAMRGILPVQAGAASGVLSTARQLGGVLGAAIVGAVLQSQFAPALRQQAAEGAASLPYGLRAGFRAAFDRLAAAGLELGAGRSATVPLPPGLPPASRAELLSLGHRVFADAYVAAMRPTVMLAVAALVVAALSCLLVRRRPEGSVPEPAARPLVDPDREVELFVD
ncbi:MAG TPA: MFS transporter, partial [Acidimicrobiales bacterium]|nr:MFS transporter [Acidimicrobiales bacterium]